MCCVTRTLFFKSKKFFVIFELFIAFNKKDLTTILVNDPLIVNRSLYTVYSIAKKFIKETCYRDL